MPSLPGSPEVPCIRCGERVAGLPWGARCRACDVERTRRARRISRRISLVACLITAAVLGLGQPVATSSRVWVAVGTLATYLLTHLIVMRVALEFLPD